MRRMELYESNKALHSFCSSVDVPIDIPTEETLSNIIKNDLLYGVGNRPTLPSCFEDEDELKQDGVDPLSDMRHDSWHDASVSMNPTFQRIENTIEVSSQADLSTKDDTSNDE